MVRPSTLEDFGGRGDTQADRGRRGMADVEVNAEALMAGGNRCSTAASAAASIRLIITGVARTAIRPEPTNGGGMLRADDDFGRAGEAGRDFGQYAAGWRVWAGIMPLYSANLRATIWPPNGMPTMPPANNAKVG